MRKWLLQIQLGTRVSQKVGPQAKLTWPCSYVTAVSVTLMCVLEESITIVPDSSSYCMWPMLNLAMRLGGMIPVYHVYCTLFELVFLSHVCVWIRYCMLWGWCENVVMTTVANDLKLLLLSYCNIDTISYQGVLIPPVILQSFHVVALTLSTIQDGLTALEQASLRGHHKVVEVLLRAGANPNLQNKVSTGQNRILPKLMPYFWCPSSPTLLHVFSYYKNI